ncbi:MAG: transglycosylase SLT domain-containing protein [Saprospiraceae bacterium]|nr:transglycosylase SLT domain-containing protein [Saprospiraceae bacterium]
MSTFKFFTRNLVMVCFLILASTFSVIASSPNNAEINKRIENMNTIIDLKVTNEVTTQIKYMIERDRRDSETLLGRTSLYFPVIENALREKDLPDELKYIAVIESSLIPHARSHQGAAGIWQFMKGTAQIFGLRIDRHIDERMDLNKSTDKALDYLQLLYEAYGNWTLALAAYNCGSGTLNKALKKANGKTGYWEIQKYLPKETQKFIPRFIAASYLMKYYYEHELQPREPSDELKYSASIKVFERIEFKKIAKEFDISVEMVKFLNPMYKKDYIPASVNGEYVLTLPDRKMYTYIEKYNSVANLLYQPFMMATKTETTNESIAENRNKISVEYLGGLKTNSYEIRDNMKSRKEIENLQNGMIIENSDPRFYQLKRKESLSDVAMANNISLSELMAMNNISESKGMNPGSIIKLSR